MMRRKMKEHWLLERDITFLNHGSFGATPISVLAAQERYRQQMEREPVRFMTRELEPLLDAVREELATFVGARPADLAFVPNATAGVNAVLRSLDLDKHDELLVTNQEYNASRNTLDYVAALEGAKVIAVDIPFPISSSNIVLERIMAAVTDRTRLVLVDHVTSQTGLVFPIAELIRELNERRIDVLVDGAHAPGMLPLDLTSLGAAYYTGNLHKWVCAPKGAAFLYVRPNRRPGIRPAIISHGANATNPNRSRYHLEFDWTGTFDPTAWLSVGDSLRTIASLVPGGWPEVMRRNHELALRGRDILCRTLGIDKPAPDDMLGSMAAIPLPDGQAPAPPMLYGDPLQDRLLEEYSIEVPVVPWPAAPNRVLRVSAQLYNEIADYERLASALTKLLPR
jgi:isopenicillin-N epimerase